MKVLSPWLAAMFRPDAFLLALCASGRKWAWALAGGAGCALLGLAYSGHWLPQTITSKAQVYGVHPGALGWLHPQGFGWMTLALLPALFPHRLKHWLYVLAPIAFLCVHVALGTVGGWWYAVPPLAMLGLAACEQVRKLWHLVLALCLVTAFWSDQWHVLNERTEREAGLWRMGQTLADKNPTGTLLLEPAGMIPYENRQLRAIDDVGLLDRWMAQRRARGPGWRTDAIQRYHPDWLVMRMREYIMPGTWTIGPTCPYYGAEDSKLAAPDVHSIGHGWAKTKMVSSNLLVLMRMPGH